MAAQVPERLRVPRLRGDGAACARRPLEAMAPYHGARPRKPRGRRQREFSSHGPGRAAFAALEERASRPSRATLGAASSRRGGAHQRRHRGRRRGPAWAWRRRRRAPERLEGAEQGTQPHVVVSAVEHDAVLAPGEAPGVSMGFSRHAACSPEPSAASSTASARWRQAHAPPIRCSCSVMAANSEVGSRATRGRARPHRRTPQAALFHTDATQALGKAPVNVVDWGCDAASFSAHKVGGPKGVGALYVKNRTPFDAYMLGGGQEAGRRSGTQNVWRRGGFRRRHPGRPGKAGR